MIQINNLSFSYSKNNVFRNLSLSLSKGNIYGLLGQNGVGKTTLLKLLSGLLRSEEESCMVNGYHPYKRQPEFLKDVYYLVNPYKTPVFQHSGEQAVAPAIFPFF
eukprot:GDKH01021560.1.p1 GENE.GDKH01021560.1~~GDKH01021560.1.p1  ORF type:complete len:105 (-),score=4.28 GDKH01021560.1:1-315(-)